MNSNQQTGSERLRSTIANIVALLTVFGMMAAAAIAVNGRLFGHSFNSETSDVESAAGDTIVINTTSLTPDIIGYAGPTPVEIRIADGVIADVKPLANAETPGFFSRLEQNGLFRSWNGLTPEQAMAKKVDGITGATFSSRAVIENVRAGLATTVGADATQSADHQPLDIKYFIILAVAIAAVSLPLFIHNVRYRRLQQLLNVAILGFWGGTFIDYTMMLNIVSAGAPAIASITTVVLLIAAFIYPLFGKKGYYCANVCPLGSLQEIASAVNNRHIHLSQRTVAVLTTFRMILWGALMLCLWTGIWTSWIDYELFAAFIVDSAATAMIIAALVLLAVSIFIPRPYCRFICPTGTLLRTSQNLNTK